MALRTLLIWGVTAYHIVDVTLFTIAPILRSDPSVVVSGHLRSDPSWVIDVSAVTRADDNLARHC